MNIVFYSSDLIACGIARGDVIARGINQTTPHYAVCKTSVGLADYFSTDVVVAQRPSSYGLIKHLEQCKAKGSLVVVDVDDDLFNLDPTAQDAFEYYNNPERRQALRDGMSIADLVTVSTPYLASRMQAECKDCDVVVIRNGIDAGHARVARESTSERSEDEVVIMWHASHTHAVDVPIIEEALIEVLKANSNVRVQMYGNFVKESFPKGLGDYNVRFDGWVNPLQLYFALAQADVGICPLAPKPFNRSKSEIKWAEYAAVGVPCVVSPEEPYKICRDGVDCIYARSKTEWVDKLNLLVADRIYRRMLGAQANVRIYDDYCHIDRAQTWVEVLTHAKNMRK